MFGWKKKYLELSAKLEEKDAEYKKCSCQLRDTKAFHDKVTIERDKAVAEANLARRALEEYEKANNNECSEACLGCKHSFVLKEYGPCYVYLENIKVSRMICRKNIKCPDADYGEDK